MNISVFTEQQKNAVNAPIGNTIVSAAAGSGKTTVLSTRVVKRILTDRATCERMLIVTFTKAAASDMRAKICKRLREEYEETHDKHLWKECLRVPYAQISTIDSFQVTILREFFREAGVAPNFSVLDTTEQSFYESKILSEMLENYYTEYPDGMDDLLRLFGGKGENEELEDAIRSLYDTLKSVPFPETWLDEKIALYRDPDTWIAALCGELRDTFCAIRDEYSRALDGETFTESAFNVLNEEYKLLGPLCSALETADYDAFVRAVRTFGSTPESVTIGQSTYGKARLRTFRELLKKLLESKLFMPFVLDGFREDLRSQEKGVTMLFETVRDYMHRMSQEYKRHNKYPFDEISAMALKLVCVQDGGWGQVSEIGRTIRERYDEIMIDEYQDVNDRQDMFFRAISERNQFVVGDVKQSIYGFRHANPGNFLAKTRTYQTIELSENFRSRGGVLGYANFLFERLFSEKLGGLTYGAGERLVCGKQYPSSGTPDAKTVLLKVRSLAENNDDRVACYIAREAKKLVTEKAQVYIYNRKTNSYDHRDIKYSDIAVLTRNRKCFDAYREAFSKCGVPIYAAGGLSFFETPEVNTVLTLLAVIDNPYSDVDLFCVMTSALYGFTAEEMALIRLENRKSRLYSAVMQYASHDEKTAAFLKDVVHLRLLAENLPIHRLIRHLYVRRQYLSVVSYGPQGAARRENLMKLYQYAKRYEDNADGSISSFLAFVRRAVEKKEKDTDASVPQGNFVRLMTMHSSKGLEYPVCFVVPTTRKIGPIKTPHCLVDNELGFAAWIRSEDMRSERTTVMNELFALREERKEAEEELRLLYVAMTRAQEKLTVVIPCTSNEKTLTKTVVDYYAGTTDSTVDPVLLRYAVSEKEILLRALCRHETFRGLTGEIGLTSVSTPEPFGFGLEESVLPTEECAELPPPPTAGLTDGELKRRFSFVYQNPLDHIPAGLSVTELVRHAAPDGEYRRLIDTVPDCEPPAFLRKEKLTASQRGSAVHLFCEKADFLRDPEEELKRLTQEGILTEEQAKAVDVLSVRAFTASDLFLELSGAAHVCREEAFLISVPASLYDPNAGEGSMLLQGAIDAAFEFENDVVVLDFKTDKCGEAELVNRYAKQLQLYAVAAQRIYEKPVRKAVIWSFHLAKAVEISLDSRA